jgi:hypothetical protein
MNAEAFKLAAKIIEVRDAVEGILALSDTWELRGQKSRSDFI